MKQNRFVFFATETEGCSWRDGESPSSITHDTTEQLQTQKKTAFGFQSEKHFIYRSLVIKFKYKSALQIM